ncbi:transposase family protein [Bacteroides bouchesdurhonensis]|uniref:transposase family protein n=1 Tax=Bacteroides bouchesdurhonensis TaxID=1841855 RepID=UPI001651B807
MFHDSTEREIPRPAGYKEQKEQYSGKKKCHTVKNTAIIIVFCLILFVSQTVPW